MIDNRYFALLDEMGTGKTKTVIDAMSEMFYSGEVKLVIVVCPNQVKGQWANSVWGQIVKHRPAGIPISIMQIESSKSPVHWTTYDNEIGYENQLNWIVVNYEAIRLGRIQKFLIDRINLLPSAMVLDESIFIKNHTALQTKACITVGRHVKRRYILNGTPLTKGPLDYFSQFSFLNSKIIGIDKFIVFRNRYAVMRPHEITVKSGGKRVRGDKTVGGRTVRTIMRIVEYQNLQGLVDRIKPFYRRITKAECLDLPNKLYQILEVPMTEEQDKHYKNMKDNLLAFIQGRIISAPIVLTKLLRLSQITSGFITDHSDEEQVTKIFSKSPKIDLTVKLIQESDKPVVVFCSFKPEIQMLCKALTAADISHGEIHGGVDNKTRENTIAEFQEGGMKVLVCQIATGGLGIELTAAGKVIFLNNTKSYALRLQAEDRVHRTGLQHNVTYIDLLSTRHKGGNTIDHVTQKGVEAKKDLIDMVLELGELDGQV